MLVIHNLPCYSLPLTMDWPPTFIWKDNVIEECLICTTSNDLLLGKQSFLNRFPLTQIGSIVNGLMWKYLIFNLWKYEIRKCSLRNVFSPVGSMNSWLKSFIFRSFLKMYPKIFSNITCSFFYLWSWLLFYSLEFERCICSKRASIVYRI